MANFGQTIKNALQSDTGQAVSGGVLGGISDWLNPDAGGSSSSSGSLTDQPWFLPVVVLGGLAVVYFATRK